MLVNCVAYENGRRLGDIEPQEISEYLKRPGCFVWVALKDATEAELRLVLDSQLLHIGKEPGLKTPPDFLPDQDKPEGIAATLERFGIIRAGTDGGTAGPSDVVPDDDDGQ